MILLTGASGFIGSHLLKALILEFGRTNVVALTSKLINECEFVLHKNYEFEEDVFVKNDFDNIDIIIHAGAFTPKTNESANHINESNSNIFNTQKLLNANLPNLEKIIYLSTLDVYKPSELITEETNTLPLSLYGWSKLYCEKLISAFAAEKDITHQILRIGHVYGPGEEAYGKLIPLTIKRIIEGNSVKIYGNGDEVRTFIYITDVIDAIIKSISLSNYIGPVNIVGNETTTIKCLINQLIDISRTKTDIEKVEFLGEVKSFVFNNSKMISYLHTPKIKLNDGLRNEFNYVKNRGL